MDGGRAAAITQCHWKIHITETGWSICARNSAGRHGNARPGCECVPGPRVSRSNCEDWQTDPSGWSRQLGCQPVNLSGLLRQRPAYPPSARRTWNEKRRNNYKNGCKIFRMACTQTVLRNITNKHWSNIDPTLAHWICWVVGLMLYHRYLHKYLV